MLMLDFELCPLWHECCFDIYNKLKDKINSKFNFLVHQLISSVSIENINDCPWSCGQNSRSFLSSTPKPKLEKQSWDYFFFA